MRSAWKNNDLAFNTMFDDEAEFTIMTTNERGTVQCCVFPREVVDPFVDSDNQSLIKSLTVLVRKSDWVFRQRQPNIGDQIKLPNNDTYKISTIDDEQNWYRLTGRSC